MGFIEFTNGALFMETNNPYESPKKLCDVKDMVVMEDKRDMKCEKCAKVTNTDDGNIWCHVLKCKNGSEFEPVDIPVEWIHEQIQKHPGHLSSAWSRLIQMYKDALIEADIKETERAKKYGEEYVRMHEDPTAAQKFWRNE